jgi:hypothetical protein
MFVPSPTACEKAVVLVERSSENKDASEDTGEGMEGKLLLAGVLLVAVGRCDEVVVGVAL